MAAKVSEWNKAVETALNDGSKPWCIVFDLLESKTGLKRTYIFYSLVVFVGFYLIFGYAAQLVCNTIGFAYPAYASMKAIESPQTRDDTKWLTYWTVFALFSIVEYPSDLLLYWFPFYWLAKCIFMVWLFMPMEYNGSVVVYKSFIRPVFLKHQGDVDNILTQVTGKVTASVADLAAGARKDK